MKALKSSLRFAILLIFFTTLVYTARAQEECSNVSTCVECLETDDCGAWAPVAGCLVDCGEIADASCYTTTTFPDFDIQETCLAAADSEADAKLCAEQKDCETCVTTTLSSSNGNETCQWFQDGQYCGSACDMTGCGVKTCIDPCDGLSCLDCLADASSSCAWIPLAGCTSECSVIDTSCYLASEHDASQVCGTDATNNNNSTDVPTSFAQGQRGLVVTMLVVFVTSAMMC